MSKIIVLASFHPKKDKVNEVKEIISNKVSEVFEKHFDKWLEKNIPNYLEEYLSLIHI